MAYIRENSKEMQVLEALVDTYTLSNVVAALREICYAKAEHLHATWQDDIGQRAWERDAQWLDKLTGKLEN